MKIGIDCRIFSSRFTGIGRYSFELVERFLALGGEHEFVLFFNQPEFSEFAEREGVKKVLVNAKHYSFAEQTRFWWKLKREKCDVVHFPHFNVPMLYRGKFVVTIHDLILSLFPGKKMTKWYHRLAYNLTIKSAVRRARRVIAVSENTRRDIERFLGVNEKSVAVIYNGVDEQFRMLANGIDAAVLRKFGIEKRFLLYTGVWRNHKNLPRLIEAFGLLRERGLDLQLVITGKSDPHYPEVLEAAARLSGEVIFTGLVSEEDLVQLHNGAVIFVFPSLYEGFGLPPLEAMACGTPVVASNVSCIPEVCGAENALFFDPLDVVEMADQMEKLYKDADLQAELVARGVKRAAEFSWERTAVETFKLICNVGAFSKFHEAGGGALWRVGGSGSGGGL
ncbi:glycosyltransferase family 4 protein [Candidatus Gracilibacteria bacterium]|nr:glycosyltransferase family 4 protein [Candidatus Gracilibacteria bacterium]